VSLVIDVDRGETTRAKKPVGERLRMLAAFSLSASEPLLMLSQQRYELVRSIERVAASKASSIDLVTPAVWSDPATSRRQSSKRVKAGT